MSYSLRDLLLDSLPEAAVSSLGGEGEYPDDLDRLINRITEFVHEKTVVPSLWELVEDWERDHNYRDYENEPLPDYVRGVRAGLMMAAKVVEGQ